MKKSIKALSKKNSRLALRLKRKMRVRKSVTGTSDRPRISVFRSLKNISVQAIDDVSGKTIAFANSLEKEMASNAAGAKKLDVAKTVGEKLGQRLLALKVEQAVFDRNGYLYAGRVSAIADGVRNAGLKI